MSTIVYRYGLLRPTENAELVRAQMLAAHRYRNVLTEIERGRRAAIRASLGRLGDVADLERDVDAAKRALDEAVDAMRHARGRTRSRSETAAARSELTVLRGAHREAVRRWRERRIECRADATIQAEHDRINDLAASLVRSARAHCGVYWGTYLLVEAAAQAARATPLFANGAEPNDPRFTRWDGAGRIGAQLQGGLSSEAAWGTDQRLRLSRTETRANGKPGTQHWLHLRVGSDGRAPVWAVWPMVMHRPLPEGSRIKWAVVSLRLRGPAEEWSVEFTLDLAAGNRKAPSGSSGAVAVDLGWRVMGDALRVAVATDERGDVDELRLDAWTLGGLRKPDELRSIRDRKFDVARAALAKWLTAQVELPDWLRSAAATIASWRSVPRMAALIRRWKASRFDGDVEAYDAAEEWRYDDHHLWAWEANQRTGSLRNRREHYRRWAAKLSARYSVLVLEDMDLSKLARRPSTGAEADNRDTDVALMNRHLAASGELRRVLCEAFVARGGEVARVPAANTTLTCGACGNIESFDAGAMVCHRCGACGELWDQDVNAGVNMLVRWRERANGNQGAVVARETKKSCENTEMSDGRWARAAKLRVQKLERRRAARS